MMTMMMMAVASHAHKADKQTRQSHAFVFVFDNTCDTHAQFTKGFVYFTKDKGHGENEFEI